MVKITRNGCKSSNVMNANPNTEKLLSALFILDLLFFYTDVCFSRINSL